MSIHPLVFFFVAVGAFPSGREDVVYPFMETFRSGIKRITFRALDQDIELRLEPAGDVIADDFTVINGKNGEIDYSVDVQDLKRKLYKDTKMGAALHIDEDGPLKINGIINPNLRIVPDSSKMSSKNGKIAHRIIEVLKDENLRHEIEKLPPGLTRTFNYTDPLDEFDCINIEYLFVAEKDFTEGFKNRSDTVESYLANMMNVVETIFDTLDLGINVIIIGIIKLTEENQEKLAPYIPSYPKGMDAHELIEKMSEFYYNSGDKLAKKADIVMLITPRQLGSFDEDGTFTGNIVGISYLGAICKRRYKYGIARDHTNLNERANTVAHESAHMLGSNHDGDGDDETGSKDCPNEWGYIMGNYGNPKNWNTFSPCSKRAIELKITSGWASCIINECGYYYE